jgi:cytochrome bd ubiquinol oxidase subunit I
MPDLLAARSQMALSLGFHIVFAAVGIAMPFLMAIAHFQALRTRDPTGRELMRAWSRGVAIFFATGAVSGTVLSFELGLLWPRFMELAGPIIGMPFSWEGAAFFVEAIALGLFLYGEKRLAPWVHWASGMVVGISGVLSGLFVVCANAWMNHPAGFDWINGHAQNIDPWAAMFNRASLGQGVHMILAAFEATGFAVAGVHAIGLLRKPRSPFHRRALHIALAIGGISALIQPVSGDSLARAAAAWQPAKFAAMEGLFHTRRPAPLLIGGIPDENSQSVSLGIEVPALLSFLAHGDFGAEVQGLDKVPRDEWPSVPVVHAAFDVMVGCGSLLALIGVLGLIALWRNPAWLERRAALAILVAVSPLGFAALEAGWVVTEVGRQPWIIYGIVRTADAVTPMPGLIYPFILFTGVYLLLSTAVAWLMVRQFRHVH